MRCRTPRPRSNPHDPLYPWVAEVLPLAEKRLRVDLRGGELLGGGMSGMAFRPKGRAYVVKLTRSAAEVAAVRAVLALRADGEPLPALVEFASAGPARLGTIRLQGETYDVHAIVKERVEPLDGALERRLPTHLRGRGPRAVRAHALAHASHAARDWPAATTAKARDRVLAEHLSWLFRAAADAPELGPVIASMEVVARSGAGPLVDVFPGNLGFATRGGARQLVAFDFEAAK